MILIYEIVTKIRIPIVSYTWHFKTKNISCILDRIYVSNTLKPDIRNVYVLPVGCSEHDTVILTFVNTTDLITGFGKSIMIFYLSNRFLNLLRISG